MSESNYEEMCTKLFNAMKGMGMDEKTIISILANLTNEQIVRNLVPKYQATQQKNLLE